MIRAADLATELGVDVAYILRQAYTIQEAAFKATGVGVDGTAGLSVSYRYGSRQSEGAPVSEAHLTDKLADAVRVATGERTER